MSEITRDTTDTEANVRTALAPDLEVLRRLGTGSSAHVYLAREPALQRLVAVKVLKPELSVDEVLRRRFEREAQSAARITHPHVTSIYRVGRLPGDVPFIVMEYIDGRTVRDVIEARGPFPVDEARRVLESVAAALAAAHARGVVHRDIRPGNVYVEKETGRAVLGDFGIAALLESGWSAASRITAAGQRVGVTAYMSPEQIRGEPVTEQSDIYGFGVLAYELLTGRGPYDTRTETQLIEAHLRHTPKPLRELRSTIDAALATLIENCLAKEPQRRPSARDVVNALDGGGIDGRDSASAAGGALEQFLAELRRRRVYQVLIAYGAFAGGMLTLGEWVFDAFDLTQASRRLFLLLTLLGFPLVLVLSWLFDVRRGRIERTRDLTATGHFRAVMWSALALCVAIAAAVAWFVLR